MDDPKVIYTNRINRAIDYILAHLDESPSLEELSKAACFSSFHFHRIFRAITGETVNFHTNRLRLEMAARLLKYSKNSATNIALECGFSSSSTMSLTVIILNWIFVFRLNHFNTIS
jgi:AraC family transcriptional regulator